MRVLLLCALAFVSRLVSSHTSLSCEVREIFVLKRTCEPDEIKIAKPIKLTDDPIYILYSVNPVEGFNLRYVLLARGQPSNTLTKPLFNTRPFLGVMFTSAWRFSSRSFNECQDTLMLVSFHHLYHWKSHFRQSNTFWNHFFDLDSLKRYTNVIDMWEFFDILIREGQQIVEIGSHVQRDVQIGEVYVLQQYEAMFESGIFIDKYEETSCSRNEYGNYHFFEFFNITEKTITCLNFQGSASLLINVLEEYKHKHHTAGKRIVLFAHAETALHDYFGDEEYWRARRSMRFNSYLQAVANAYREEFYGSTDERDFVQRPHDWTEEKPYRDAIGGEYLCVHMRRADFVYGREAQLPTLRSAANQIKRALVELGLHRVYLSSDCAGSEFHDMKSMLRSVSLYKFKPPWEYHVQLQDGGLAVIDQIICSHAKWFIGTFESTFTYRIYEEREILGFPTETTFNTFCKRDDLLDCNRNSVWPIRY